MTLDTIITKFEDLDLNKYYTYADYLTWQFKERVELIQGKIFKMSPAPSSLHQLVSSNLHRDIANFLRKKNCKVFAAPFDVRLTKQNTLNENIITVVQPDLCVVCDKSKIDKKGCKGAPDLVIEILSPANSQIELNKKYDLYQANEVKEYWIVFPFETSIQVNILDESGQYRSQRIVGMGEIIPSQIFPQMQIQVNDIFEDLDLDL